MRCPMDGISIRISPHKIMAGIATMLSAARFDTVRRALLMSDGALGEPFSSALACDVALLHRQMPTGQALSSSEPGVAQGDILQNPCTRWYGRDRRGEYPGGRGLSTSAVGNFPAALHFDEGPRSVGRHPPTSYRGSHSPRDRESVNCRRSFRIVRRSLAADRQALRNPVPSTAVALGNSVQSITDVGLEQYICWGGNPQRISACSM